MFPNLMVEMKLKHYSQRGLAKYVDMSEKSMSKKMNGRTEFTLREMRRIQTVFPNCSIDYLFVKYGEKE